ncbi:4'-phosphopantetheinyl transferase family protein [Amycolatopsis suaedae]|uniref:4'-phosphopantetheinyl transferase superfamily protein n=1 Tax=Amycolatopsis suaedae TaxID=2510978 RepID=A0A4Q7J6Q2_9PSEU|nr:4'-phosphopantetheinyl transferase superfamily protein [Amycolatopsis suaedae]RZQ63320.1 4'-phosphopantetheinyl transferase superfamily protein [Amycolatopsis suaedae]
MTTVWWAEPLPATGEFLALLDEDETGRFGGYRQDADKRRFLTGRVLAKSVVAEILGTTPGSVRFDASCVDCGKPHGPPRVPGTDLTLSISHSGDRIGLAVDRGVPLGLDVEKANRNVDSLVDYALNDSERATLTGLAGDELVRAFFVYWTRKEAVMKATGRGLKIPLQSITLSPHTEPARLLASADAALSPEGTRMADLDPGDGYRAALAALTTVDLTVTEKWWTP